MENPRCEDCRYFEPHDFRIFEHLAVCGCEAVLLEHLFGSNAQKPKVKIFCDFERIGGFCGPTGKYFSPK